MAKRHDITATVLGIGNIGFAPGTWGSLAGLPLCIVLHAYPVVYFLFFAAVFAAGVISSGVVERGSGTKDPSHVIIDEFAGIFAVFCFLPLSPGVVIAGFILFRLFDIVKPFPVRSVEKVGGGWGIMLDDLLAGIYANLALRLILLTGLI